MTEWNLKNIKSTIGGMSAEDPLRFPQELEERIEEYALGYLHQGRAEWDEPHTRAVTFYAGEIAMAEGLDVLAIRAAAWLHDIGCIKDRNKHHEISASLLLGNTSLVEILTEKYAICLKYIILAHRARYPIEDVPKDHENIRLRMICAIFRLMDACEICYPKCPSAVYEVIKDSLNEKARQVWIGHKNILDLKFNKPEIRIFVNEIDKCQFMIDDLNMEISTIRDTFEENDIPVPIVRTI